MSQEVVRRYQEFHSVVNCKNTEWLRSRRPKTERRKKPATSVAMTDFGGKQRAAGTIWRLRNGVEELGWRGAGVIALVKSSPFQIRGATCGDAAGILECLRAAFGEYRADYTEGAYLDTVLTAESVETRLSKSTVCCGGWDAASGRNRGL